MVQEQSLPPLSLQPENYIQFKCTSGSLLNVATDPDRDGNQLTATRRVAEDSIEEERRIEEDEASMGYQRRLFFFMRGGRFELSRVLLVRVGGVVV